MRSKMRFKIIYMFSIYTLSDLGDLSNLTGSLCRTMTLLHRGHEAVNIKENEIAVANWVFCQSFIARTFLKIQEYPSVDDFEGKKRLHGV